jgi:hypothetical protein
LFYFSNYRYSTSDKRISKVVQAPDLSVESIPNRKSKILKPPHLSVGSISNLKSQISNRLTVIGRLDIADRIINGILTKQPNKDSPEKIPITNAE